MNFLETQLGRIVDPGVERHQRITRINRSTNRLHYSAAVTDSMMTSLEELQHYYGPFMAEEEITQEFLERLQAGMRRDGVVPPWRQENRILGFAVQLTEEDIDCERICLPNRGFYAPGDAVCISLNERIKAFAPCDVRPGDPVTVHPYSGLPSARGIQVGGATWESEAMSGELAVIQISTRGVRP